MNRILFVDDEPSVLDGLRRMLRPLREEWHMEFAASGMEALAILARDPYDVIVSDMRMPGMDGAELLDTVMHRFPRMVRIVLSGQADRASVLRSLAATHQYLAKPCDAATIKATLTRACALRDLLADPGLIALVSHVHTIPSLPDIYARLVEECRSPKGSLRTVAEIMAEDVGMTAKILQLVNSSFFGRARRISSPLDAVQLLGMETVKALLLLAHVFSQLEAPPAQLYSPVLLQRRSLATSAAARLIAVAERADPEAVEEAAAAGLLHDVGELVLAANLPDRFAKARQLAAERGGDVIGAEMEVLGASHAMMGAYLLGLWGLPDVVVEAVAFHHAPAECVHHGFGPLAAVHVAASLVPELTGADPGLEAPALDLDYVRALGLAERLDGWRRRCVTRLRAEGGDA